MLDTVLRRYTDGALAPVAARLAGWRVAANSLTMAAFVCGLVALFDIGHRLYLSGLVLLAIAAIFDSLDGPLARREGPTALGAYLDLFLGLVIAAAVPFAFALAQPDRALAAMFLMLGLVARAAAAASEARLADGGLLAKTLGQGALLIGKTELFAAFAIACLFPDWFSIVAYVVGILCFVAAGARVAEVASS